MPIPRRRQLSWTSSGVVDSSPSRPATAQTRMPEQWGNRFGPGNWEYDRGLRQQPRRPNSSAVYHRPMPERREWDERPSTGSWDRPSTAPRGGQQAPPGNVFPREFTQWESSREASPRWAERPPWNPALQLPGAVSPEMHGESPTRRRLHIEYGAQPGAPRPQHAHRQHAHGTALSPPPAADDTGEFSRTTSLSPDHLPGDSYAHAFKSMEVGSALEARLSLERLEALRSMRHRPAPAPPPPHGRTVAPWRRATRAAAPPDGASPRALTRSARAVRRRAETRAETSAEMRSWPQWRCWAETGGGRGARRSHVRPRRTSRTAGRRRRRAQRRGPGQTRRRGTRTRSWPGARTRRLQGRHAPGLRMKGLRTKPRMRRRRSGCGRGGRSTSASSSARTRYSTGGAGARFFPFRVSLVSLALRFPPFLHFPPFLRFPPFLVVVVEGAFLPQRGVRLAQGPRRGAGRALAGRRDAAGRRGERPMRASAVGLEESGYSRPGGAPAEGVRAYEGPRRRSIAPCGSAAS